MIVSIDNETVLRLRGLKGTRLVRIMGRRYPNPPSYDHVQLVTEDGTITAVEVRMEDVSEKLEVSCIAAREVVTVAAPDRCDEIRLADFRVDQVLVLRRAEWLETPEHGVSAVGDSPEQQRFADPSEVPPWTMHALVDAGIMLVDDRGSRLVIQADTFPIVMQLHYSVSSTSIPRGEARTLEA
jgi:hypothetical protein